MSTITIEKNGNTTTLSGDMTNDFEQMKRECAGRFESMFGDVKKLLPKLGEALTHEHIMQVYNEGFTKSFYDKNKIYCYFCVNPDDYSNYMFSPSDSENRDNRFARIRMGVLKFFQDDFDVYIIPCA